MQKDDLRTFRDLTVMFMKSPDGSEIVGEEEPRGKVQRCGKLGKRSRKAFPAGGGGGGTFSPAG